MREIELKLIIDGVQYCVVDLEAEHPNILAAPAEALANELESAFDEAVGRLCAGDYVGGYEPDDDGAWHRSI